MWFWEGEREETTERVKQQTHTGIIAQSQIVGVPHRHLSVLQGGLKKKKKTWGTLLYWTESIYNLSTFYKLASNVTVSEL